MLIQPPINSYDNNSLLIRAEFFNCLDMVCMMIFGLLSSDDMSNSENRNSMSLVKYTKINCVNSKNSARMSSELLSYEFIGG